MRTKTLLATAFIVPLLIMACDRADQSPTAAADGNDNPAMAASPADQMMESAPPAAGGVIPPNDTAGAQEMVPDNPAVQPDMPVTGDEKPAQGTY